MLGTRHLMSWRDRISVAAVLLLAVLAGGCSAGGIAPGHGRLGRSSFRALGFFPESAAKSPQPVVGAQSDVICPPIEVRQGASTLAIGPSGENTTMSLKYQGSFVRVARDCSVAGGDMVIKVGVQGRIVVGPAGGPGGPGPAADRRGRGSAGGFKPIVTKLVRIPVTVAPGQGSVVFSHIEQGMSFPPPTPSSQLDDYIVYVGFDPLAAEPKEPAKPKPKGKPAPPKANPSQ